MTAALALLILCLLLLALAALFATAHPWMPRLVQGGCGTVSAGFAGLGLAGLALGGGNALLLPVGPPWAPLSLMLDGLSAWFLVLLGLVGLASSIWSLMQAEMAARRRLVPYPLFLASMALTLLAADGFTLLLGFELMSLASWVLIASGHEEEGKREAARLYLGFALFGAACLIPALGLLAGLSGDLSFAAMRAAPPQGWAAAVILLLVVAGAGAKAGLVPLHGWLPPAHAAAPVGVSALLSGAMTKVALYVVARLVLDLGGPAQPLWWGVPLLVLGGISAVHGALRATQEGETKTLLACSTIEHVGLIALGLGLSAALRAADLGPLAALAAGAALLHALAHALFKSLLFLAAGEIQNGAGSRRLDSLGGLIHAMPLVALCALLGVGAAAALPPLSGFAAEWLLLQSLFAAWRVGDFGFQVLVVAALAAVALAAALGAAAMLRFWGLAFLGRPRTPRTMGAQDAAPLPRAVLIGLAALSALAGLLPGPLLQLGAPALALVSGHPGLPEARPLSVSASQPASDYLPIVLALVLAVAVLGLAALLRGLSPRPSQRGSVWDGGFMAPPAILPFGDPTTQPSAAGFAQPLRRMLGAQLLAVRESLRPAAPGDPAPARLESQSGDAVSGLVSVPLARGRDWLVLRAERLRDLSLQQFLGLAFGTLVVMLVLLAWLGTGA